jgi:hypothetical protein
LMHGHLAEVLQLAFQTLVHQQQGMTAPRRLPSQDATTLSITSSMDIGHSQTRYNSVAFEARFLANLRLSIQFTASKVLSKSLENRMPNLALGRFRSVFDLRK